MLSNIKEQIQCHDEDAVNVSSIAKLSETRWTVRAACFKVVLITMLLHETYGSRDFTIIIFREMLKVE